ncbi:MAG: hypothetical protein JXR71_12085 [Bacteroidales bacterium]|nr:hypothetical protein [Bacteroidales bacterium]
MTKQKTILICPMDWGLGHATRVVPIIEVLLEEGARVIIGADNKPLAFLKHRFPQCESVKIPGFQPSYQKKGSLALKMTADIPQMLIESKKAHDLLEKIIKKMNVDAVISDSRYELYSNRVPTIFITHQLRIQTQGLLAATRTTLQSILYGFIKKHNEVWIPDFETEPNLSGELSHVKRFPAKKVYFIGPLSRFQKLKNVVPSGKKYDVLCIMSGPEPQRTMLEDIFMKQALETQLKTLILSGKPGENSMVIKENVEIRSHVSDEEMASLILSAGLVISRSGYTTLMDLATLGKKAVYIPTPGQPEQIYLADRLKQLGLYYTVSQKNFDLPTAFQQANQYDGMEVDNNYTLLKERLVKLLES